MICIYTCLPVKVTLARVVTGAGFTDSSLSTLKRLHWLPIYARIKFKIATLTYRAFVVVVVVIA